MATAVKVRIPQPTDGIALTLTMEEAQRLRSILGHSDYGVTEDSGLRAIYDALSEVTEVEPEPGFYITRRYPF